MFEKMIKNIGFLVITLFLSVNSYAEVLEDKTLNELIKENYKINEQNLATGYFSQGYIYFVLENENSEIVVCKVPGTNFSDKTFCKKP